MDTQNTLNAAPLDAAAAAKAAFAAVEGLSCSLCQNCSVVIHHGNGVHMDTQNTLNAAPLDAAAAAKAAFAAVEGLPFPDDIFTAPELRWAVIGCGVIANQMAQSLALAGRKVYGVANRTLVKAEAFAAEYGVARVYRTVEELYADPAVDAIYITTPHNTPIEYLRGVLAAGKHVLCEKAITLNSDELAEARAIADEHHVVLMDATTVPLRKGDHPQLRGARGGARHRCRARCGAHGRYHRSSHAPLC